MTFLDYLSRPLTNRKLLITALLDEVGENEGTFDMIVKHMSAGTLRESRFP